MKTYSKFKSDNVQYLTCTNASSGSRTKKAVLENGMIIVDIDGVASKTVISGLKRSYRILNAAFVPVANVSSTVEFQVYSIGAVSASHLAVDFDGFELFSSPPASALEGIKGYGTMRAKATILPDNFDPTKAIVSGGAICIRGSGGKAISLTGQLTMAVMPA